MYAEKKLSKTPPDTKTKNCSMEERERIPPPAETSSGADNSCISGRGTRKLMTTNKIKFRNSNVC